MYVVDIGPHMHMDIELVSEALRTCFLSKVNADVQTIEAFRLPCGALIGVLSALQCVGGQQGQR